MHSTTIIDIAEPQFTACVRPTAHPIIGGSGRFRIRIVIANTLNLDPLSAPCLLSLSGRPNVTAKYRESLAEKG
jgi:hypothetical protein